MLTLTLALALTLTFALTPTFALALTFALTLVRQERILKNKSLHKRARALGLHTLALFAPFDIHRPLNGQRRHALTLKAQV